MQLGPSKQLEIELGHHSTILYNDYLIYASITKYCPLAYSIVKHIKTLKQTSQSI